MEKSINTESRNHAAAQAAPPKPLTARAKTKLGFGGLTFSPAELIGVNLDSVSLNRAAELGIQAEQVSRPGAERNLTRLMLPPGLDAIHAQELLARELPGRRFELNRIYRLYRAAMRDDFDPTQPGDAPSGNQPCTPERCFARELIRWQDNFAACARGLRVGIIDTGVDIAHPAFKGRRIFRNALAPDHRNAAPDWHGTGVLAILAGDPSSTTPGLIPDADFFVASIFFAEDGGAMATDTISLVKAFDWMRLSEVKLINMSFAGPRDDLVMEDLQELSGRGVVLVAAAGNEGPAAEPAYPAAYPNVVAVTAVTKDLRNYRYANRGSHIDLAAPGVDIWTAVPGGREGYHSGTSFAAPHATGILAVLPANYLKKRKDDLLANLNFSDLGAPGRDPIYGRGLLLAPSSCPALAQTIASAK